MVSPECFRDSQKRRKMIRFRHSFGVRHLSLIRHSSLVIRHSVDTTHLVLLSLAIALIAFLYSSVGHAGASGYIATMTLFGVAPTVIRPTALVLNILVASIGTFQFWRAGYFSWKLFWPFALFSIPAAYLGGYLQPSASVLKVLIGLVLLFSAARLVFRRGDPPHTFAPSRPTAISVGAGLGFL